MENTQVSSYRWLYLFIGVFGVHLGSIIFNFHNAIVFTKPLLLLVLFFFYFFESQKASNTNLKILGALAFSWAGDVLLIFQHQHSLFFIFGLISFLIAHILYALFFFQKVDYKKINLIFLGIVLIYGLSLCILLQPKLGGMQIPVFIYAAVISIMLLTVLHLPKQSISFLFVAIGSILFVLSDSILAFNKFHTSFLLAGLLIMFTYGLAQLFLVLGVLKMK